MKKFRANRKKTFYRTTKQIHAQDNHMLSSLKRDFISFEEEYAIRPKGGVRSARVLPYSKAHERRKKNKRLYPQFHRRPSAREKAYLVLF